MRAPVAVTFDYGQTLACLDTTLLAERLAERGQATTAARLEASVPAAWAAYDGAIAAGHGGHPWHLMMRALLEEAGVAPGASGALVDFLWAEQPRKNLWRRPIPGMIELVRDLRARGVPLAVLSNSEGRMDELLTEMGFRDAFDVVADSGRLGIEKPDRAIFAWTAERLGVALEDTIHVGDSLRADVEGALNAGMRAIWYRGDTAAPPRERVAVCADADETRAALRAFGVDAERR